MDAFTSFVLENAHADAADLLLRVKAWPAPEDPLLSDLDPKSLAVHTVTARRKLERKLPGWHACPGLVYPTSLCAEQCSSAPTAARKAALVRRILADRSGGRVADLTGGLGVDAVAFSSVCEAVLYNERDASLAAAARHNFPLLGARNITVRNLSLQPGGLAEVLDGFTPDLIYIDPARRDDGGKKVFLLEDCSPDVLPLLPELLAAAPHVLLKLSPMADLTMVAERLSRAMEPYYEAAGAWRTGSPREIHAVSREGECRELLVWLDRGYAGPTMVVCAEDDTEVSFSSDELSSARARLPEAPYGTLLFEPGKSLLKAGAANALCTRYPLVKLARFTHLFFADGLDTAGLTALAPMGKFFTVKAILPFSKASMREVRDRFPRADVSARNLPLSSDELRARLGLVSGGGLHVFGVRIDMPHASEKYLVVGERKNLSALLADS